MCWNIWYDGKSCKILEFWRQLNRTLLKHEWPTRRRSWLNHGDVVMLTAEPNIRVIELCQCHVLIRQAEDHETHARFRMGGWGAATLCTGVRPRGRRRRRPERSKKVGRSRGEKKGGQSPEEAGRCDSILWPHSGPGSEACRNENVHEQMGKHFNRFRFRILL